MPVRFLHSPVLKWPDPGEVLRALAAWARGEVVKRSELRRLGYFGSYAREEAGVGSDLDLVAVVRTAARPFEERGLDWDLLELPVPAEILVYASGEWERMHREKGRFASTMAREARWLFPG